MLSVGTARCLGACGAAPVVVFDEEMLGKVTPEMALARTEEWMSHADH
jgi:bidirectional [NiFe] hydrogenase diaphorase subunit